MANHVKDDTIQNVYITVCEPTVYLTLTAIFPVNIRNFLHCPCEFAIPKRIDVLAILSIISSLVIEKYLPVKHINSSFFL